MGRNSRFILLVLATAAWLLPGMPIASAVCASEEGIFRQATNFAGGSIDVGYGTGGTLRVVDRGLDNCQDVFTVSTAHLNNATNLKMAEVGWVEWEDGGVHSWHYFFEAQDSSQVWGNIGNGGNLPSAASSAYWARFWVNNKDGTTRFNMYVDKDNNGTVDHSDVTPTWCCGFSHGWPEGETSKIGGTGTGASDHQKELQWQNSSNTWIDWANNAVQSDQMACWHSVYVAGNEYQVVKNTGC